MLSSFLVLNPEASGPPLHNNVTRDRLASRFLSDSIRGWRLQSELTSGSESDSSWWQYHLHGYEMIFRLVFEVCLRSSCFLSLHQYPWLKISRTLVIFLIVASWWRRCTLSLSSWHSLIPVRCWRSWFYDFQWNWEIPMTVHCLFWFSSSTTSSSHFVLQIRHITFFFWTVAFHHARDFVDKKNAFSSSFCEQTKQKKKNMERTENGLLWKDLELIPASTCKWIFRSKMVADWYERMSYYTNSRIPFLMCEWINHLENVCDLSVEMDVDHRNIRIQLILSKTDIKLTRCGLQES